MTRRHTLANKTIEAAVVFATLLVVSIVLSSQARAQNPVPFLEQPLVPAATAPGGPGFTLTVNGAGFVAASVVNWNGSPRITTFVSSKQLTATILASDIATASTASVTAANPTPGGGVSNPQFFSIATAGTSVSFAPAVTYSSGGTDLASLVVADVNGDGKPDIIVANSGASVGVLLGNGDGTFQPALLTDIAPAGGFAGQFNSVAVADVNGDGKPDLIVATCCLSNGDGAAAVLLGNGDGTFQPPATYDAGGGWTPGLVVADINGDGKLDIVAANYYENTVGVLLGNGNGTFQQAILSAASIDPFNIAIADVNRDGRLDLIVSASGGPDFDAVGILLGNGDGTFQPVTYYLDGGCSSAVAADVNGDAVPDLVAANTGSAACGPDAQGFAGILLGNGSGAFQPESNYLAINFTDNGVGGVAVADLNGDGKLDVMVTSGTQLGSTPGMVGVLLDNGNGTFQTAVTFPTGGTQADAVVAADVNGDGRPDIIAANFYSSVGVLLNTTSSSHQCVGKCATFTALVSSLNPSIYGQKVTWTATVTPSGTATPTGKVGFTWGSGSSLGAATLNASGVATLTRSNLNADPYPLVAVYSGDTNNLASSSLILNQEVTQTTSTATLSSSSNPSTLGQTVTFTAKITSPTTTPTGPVTFSAGHTTLATVELTRGEATFTTSTLPTGSATITVTYPWNSNIAASSASLTQVVQ
jgi:hypothetical protein